MKPTEALQVLQEHIEHPCDYQPRLKEALNVVRQALEHPRDAHRRPEMTEHDALQLIQAHLQCDLYPNSTLSVAVAVISAALQNARDFYLTAHRFATASDDCWALIRSGQWVDFKTAMVAYDRKQVAAQALILQLRNIMGGYSYD